VTSWINLTTRLGHSISNPSDEDLKNALKELFDSKDNEHPDSWIECGSEDGPLETLSIYSSGYALYTKFSDADMSDELETKRVDNVTQESGLEIWKNLISST